jgi:hypothetical protein
MCRSLTVRRPGLSAAEVVVVLLILVVAAALLVPALLHAREAQAQLECVNNVKQIVLGMHDCHKVHNRLPPAVGYFPGDKAPEAYGTALFHLLPFIEQKNLYDLARASDGGSFYALNNDVYTYSVPTFLCPSDPSVGADGRVKNNEGFSWGASNYAGNVQVFSRVYANGYLLDPQGRTRFDDIKDGLSNTILFAEHYAHCTNAKFPVGGSLWAYSMLGSQAEPLHPGFAWSWTVFSVGPSSRFQVQPEPSQGNCDPTLASTPHRVLLVGLCDGRVRPLSPTISGDTWWAACTPRGAEILGPDW